MTRLCERPGCSEAASVAYGMRPEDLVFWLDALGTDGERSFGVLCRRHADAMVVPKNWTLDDLRDPDLHLFRPPPVNDVDRPRRRRASTGHDTAEQLRLDSLSDGGQPLPPPEATPESVDATASDAVAPAEHPDGQAGDDPAGDDEPDAAAWTPSFDADDDLDGLLSARSPLLARAFRGDDRPQR